LFSSHLGAGNSKKIRANQEGSPKSFRRRKRNLGEAWFSEAESVEKEKPEIVSQLVGFQNPVA
jgi:hypothetical protein